MEFEAKKDKINIERKLSPNSLKVHINNIEVQTSGKANVQKKIEEYTDFDLDGWKSFISMSINNFKNFMNLSPEEKAFYTEKINNFVNDNDPRLIAAKPHLDKIKSLQEEVKSLETEKDETIRELKTEELNKQIAEEKKLASEKYSENKEILVDGNPVTEEAFREQMENPEFVKAASEKGNIEFKNHPELAEEFNAKVEEQIKSNSEEVDAEEGEFVVQGTFDGHQVVAGNKAYEVSDQRQIGQAGKTEVVETIKDGKKIFTLVTPNKDNYGRRGYMGVSLVLPEGTKKSAVEIREILDAKQKEVSDNLKDGVVSNVDLTLKTKNDGKGKEEKEGLLEPEKVAGQFEIEKDIANTKDAIKAYEKDPNSSVTPALREKLKRLEAELAELTGKPEKVAEVEDAPIKPDTRETKAASAEKGQEPSGQELSKEEIEKIGFRRSQSNSSCYSNGDLRI